MIRVVFEIREKVSGMTILNPVITDSTTTEFEKDVARIICAATAVGLNKGTGGGVSFIAEGEGTEEVSEMVRKGMEAQS